MGVDETLPVTEDRWEENAIPDTDGIEEIREDLKRVRAESSVSVSGRTRKSQPRLRCKFCVVAEISKILLRILCK
jgi:hypothetical protein